MRFLNRKLWPGVQPAAQGRLSRLVAQTAVDPDLRAREISGLPDATRSYAIFFVARSGSTSLAARPAEVVGIVRRQVFGTDAPGEAEVKPSNIEKFGDSRNQAFEERFRRDEVLLVHRLETERPPLHSAS
ncbi:MAG: hypothetical protein HQ465_20520, partial [Rhodospirillales bacterium]|nr:hypothetical protein [Rhodospirillales bacterium]